MSLSRAGKPRAIPPIPEAVVRQALRHGVELFARAAGIGAPRISDALLDNQLAALRRAGLALPPAQPQPNTEPSTDRPWWIRED